MLSREPYPGLTDERSAGNGSLMRLCPVPMFYAADPVRAIELSGESSRTTHALPLVVDACRYFGGLIAGAYYGAAAIPQAWRDCLAMRDLIEAYAEGLMR